MGIKIFRRLLLVVGCIYSNNVVGNEDDYMQSDSQRHRSSDIKCNSGIQRIICMIYSIALSNTGKLGREEVTLPSPGLFTLYN